MKHIQKIFKSLSGAISGYKKIIKGIISWKYFPLTILGYFGVFALEIALEDGTMRMATLDLLGKTSINVLVLIGLLSYSYIIFKFVKTWKSL